MTIIYIIALTALAIIVAITLIVGIKEIKCILNIMEGFKEAERMRKSRHN